METLWHSIWLNCPVCKQEATLLQAMYSADSEFQFLFACMNPNCNLGQSKKVDSKKVIRYKAFSNVLNHKALLQDIDAHCGKCQKVQIGKPLRPPLAIAEGLTEDDKKFEREMGIDPEEEQ